jgi:protoporphyrinogen oxidase
MISTKKKYAVLGAGPMGLMCTMELLKAGHEVDLYERDDRIGGMSASFDFDGLKIERYYHFICKTDYPLFELLDELDLVSALHWVDTKMGYYYNGQLHEWGNPWGLLKFPGLGIISKFRYALHAMYVKNIRDWSALDKKRATDWIRKWIGRRAYEVLWSKLFELKFFELSEDLSAAWIGTRIKRVALSRKNLFQESMGYLEGGSDTLLEKMEAFILQHGGRIHLSSGIERVNVANGCVHSILMHGGEERSCDSVISTAPIQYVPSLVPDLPADFVRRIHEIRNIPVACVILKLKHPISGNFWMNINDPNIEIPGIIEYSNLNPLANNVVYAPFYMPKSHPKWQVSNAALIDEVIGYMERLNSAFRKDWVLASHCHRYEFAQTICPPGFYSMLPPMKTPLKGFYMADTSYYYPEDRSINESIAVGRKLARLAE